MTRTRLLIGTLGILIALLIFGMVFANLRLIQQGNAQAGLRRAQTELRRTQTGLHRFIVESCDRLNILRAEDNVSHLADYKIFRVVYIQARSQSGLTERLFGRRVANAVARSQKTLQVQVRSAVFAKSWTPLTNCRQAVNRQGVAYRAPQPIGFVDRLPPAAALRPPP